MKLTRFHPYPVRYRAHEFFRSCATFLCEPSGDNILVMMMTQDFTYSITLLHNVDLTKVHTSVLPKWQRQFGVEISVVSRADGRFLHTFTFIPERP